MTAFDPQTAYRNEGQWKSFSERVTWEKQTDAGPVLLTGLTAQWSDFDTPESQSVAAGLSFTNDAAAVVVWQPTLADGSEPTVRFAPAEGQILRRESKANEGWMIRSLLFSRFGHWVCACEREVVNG